MDANELFALLEKIGIEGIIQRGHNFQARCPAHQERTPSWGISLVEPHFHGCFACNFKGTLYDLLLRIGHYSESKARRLSNLSESEFNLPQFEMGEKQEATFSLVDESELYPFVFTDRISRYLRKRGVCPSTARKTGCVHHKLKKRILFPWYLDNNLVGVTGRTLVKSQEDEFKTLPFFGTKKGQALYLPQRRITSKPLVLVEGEIDALKVYCSGFRNVGAFGFGRFTDQQASLVLNSEAEDVIVFTDDDDTGKLLLGIIVSKLSGLKKIHAVNYQPFRQAYASKLDPGELTRHDIRRALTECLERNVDWSSF